MLSRGRPVPMIALRIHHNDVPLCVAGAPDLIVLNAIVNAVGKLGPDTTARHGRKDDDEPPDLFLSAGGLTARSGKADDHLRWVQHAPLAIGDRITITLLETDAADEPADHTPRAPDRADEEMEYQKAKATYLRLRGKYERDEGEDR